MNWHTEGKEGPGREAPTKTDRELVGVLDTHVAESWDVLLPRAHAAFKATPDGERCISPGR